MKAISKRTISAAVFLLWVGAFSAVIFLQESASITEFAFPLLALGSLGVVIFHGTSKFSSITGKILIFAGLFATISLLVENGLDIANMEGLIATMGLATGVYLERINPHQRLKPWMLLGIATKVQFMIATALISLGRSIDFQSGVAPLETWWIVVVLMACGAPLLMFKKKAAYRTVMLVTSVLVILLSIELILTETRNGIMLSLMLLAFLWPLLVERMIGKKVFLHQEDA